MLKESPGKNFQMWELVFELSNKKDLFKTNMKPFFSENEYFSIGQIHIYGTYILKSICFCSHNFWTPRVNYLDWQNIKQLNREF
jgi:hypothetical protein